MSDAEALLKFGHDETEDLIFSTEIVLKPKSPQEISTVVKYCNQNHITITVQEVLKCQKRVLRLNRY